MAYASLSSKGIFLTFIESPTIIGDVYAELLQTEFFPWARRKRIINKIYFIQAGATSHRTSNVFVALLEVYGARVIGLGYPKFATGGMEWPLCSLDLNPADFYFWGYIEDRCYADNPQTKEELKKANSCKHNKQGPPTTNF